MSSERRARQTRPVKSHFLQPNPLAPRRRFDNFGTLLF